MIILNGNEPQHVGPLAVSIGFFDGVHLGHLDLLKQLCREASARGLKTAVVTFPESPRKVLWGDQRKERLLTTIEEKREALSETGIHYCIELPFTQELSRLTAEAFMQKYLKERYETALLLVGYDHRFGHDGTSDFRQYKAQGEAHGITVIKALPYIHPEGMRISSTLIRGLLSQGDVETAAVCLGRPYTLSGTVVQGKQLGRRIGFPTANMQPDSPDKLIPLNGVYAVRAHVGEEIYNGMLNIGLRPTVDQSEHISIETNLFHFEGDLYGRHMELELIYRMRDEHKFSSLDALKNQLSHDVRRAQTILSKRS